MKISILERRTNLPVRQRSGSLPIRPIHLPRPGVDQPPTSSLAPIRYRRTGGTGVPGAPEDHDRGIPDFERQIRDPRIQQPPTNSASHPILLTRNPSSHSSGSDPVALHIRGDLSVENTSFGLAPQEKTRQVLVLRVRFNDLQSSHPVVKHLGRQPALLKTHCHVIRPAHLAAGEAVLDKGKWRIWQSSPWQIRLDYPRFRN
jgi:hypothetical protein